MFGKVLVANRGEIAVRIIRALRELGIRSVAVYSDADRNALHVRLADEAAHIGPASSSESYLRIDRILEAATRHRAEAIHPGYGFLSENADFAAAVEATGIVFVGPSASSIRRLGSKTAARILAKQMNVPVVPGNEEPATHLDHARALAQELGYPVLLKAAAGGGGKGMRRVDREADLEGAIRDATSEAERAFRSGEVYIEKVIERPRHIEMQIVADNYGNFVHLGERECSLQRRHQKVVEECPSPLVAMNPELRDAMGEAALRIARAAQYRNLGTAEFLVDQDKNFYFLEVNTRLQVEHPVTELVTGLDLVHLQLKIAWGEAIPFAQEDVTWRGAAIECRVCAEDPERDFFPSPGKILQLSEPAGPGIRLDSGIYPGWTIPLEYDPLLAKLVAWAPDRHGAIERISRALDEYAISGVATNLGFFREIMQERRFRQGDLDTGFIADFFRHRRIPECVPDLGVIAALAAASFSKNHQPETKNGQSETSRWLSQGRSEQLR